MSKIPMKKVGADWPTSASPIAVSSTAELRRTAEMTTVETSQSAMAARSSREPRKGRRPRMRDGAEPERAPPGYAALRAAELEVEAPDLELLQRIRRPLHVLLQAVVLVRLDHGDPGQMLEEDL